MYGAPTRDAALVSRLLNHHDIRPTIENGLGYIEGAWFTEEPACHIYAGDGGIFMFAALGDDEYMAHVGLTRRARGVYGVKLGREAFAYLFGSLRAHRCHARAPLHLPQVAVFAKCLGFKHARLDEVGGFEHLVKETE